MLPKQITAWPNVSLQQLFATMPKNCCNHKFGKLLLGQIYHCTNSLQRCRFVLLQWYIWQITALANVSLQRFFVAFLSQHQTFGATFPDSTFINARGKMHSLQEDHSFLQVWSSKLRKYEKSWQKSFKSFEKSLKMKIFINARRKMHSLQEDHPFLQVWSSKLRKYEKIWQKSFKSFEKVEKRKYLSTPAEKCTHYKRTISLCKFVV